VGVIAAAAVAVAVVAAIIVFLTGGKDTPPVAVAKPPREAVQPSAPPRPLGDVGRTAHENTAEKSGENTAEKVVEKVGETIPVKAVETHAKTTPTPVNVETDPRALPVDQRGAAGLASAVLTADAGTSLAPPPEDAEYARLIARGQSAVQAERFKTAVTSFRKALALKPGALEARAGLGVALAGSDGGAAGYREAIDLLTDVLRKDSGNARAWLSLGLAYQMLGSDMQAVAPYKRYLALEPRGRFADDVRSALTLILE
jgi:tetratricopeptide (TPR) repeat protein